MSSSILIARDKSMNQTNTNLWSIHSVVLLEKSQGHGFKKSLPNLLLELQWSAKYKRLNGMTAIMNIYANLFLTITNSTVTDYLSARRPIASAQSGLVVELRTVFLSIYMMHSDFC